MVDHLTASSRRNRLSIARASLEGLSVGDAFGEQFFDVPQIVEPAINVRFVPEGTWRFTDDTMMAMSVYNCLSPYGGIDPAKLAADFARRYDRTRGYGPSMHQLLADIRLTPSLWSELAKRQIGGAGSWGNGSAMRVAPVGAYFYEDLDAVVEHARRSAITTHTHPEAIAGAIAIAIAAALAVRTKGSTAPTRPEFLTSLLPYVPDSLVREGIRKARDMDAGTSVRHAVAVLGNGVQISCQDTVPFALWCAGEHLGNYEEALWLTVEGLGDRDTTCAIVGSIVAARTGIEGIPEVWSARREPLPEWVMEATELLGE